MKPICNAFILLMVSMLMAQAADDWREANWPYPRDAWPKGQALSCMSAICSEHELILTRVKFGFCNCETGVRDDAEVDYVADVDLINPNFVGLAEGHPISLFGLKGRVRFYRYEAQGHSAIALGIALARRCDVIAISVDGLTSEDQAAHLVEAISHSAPIADYLSAILGEAITMRATFNTVK
jgi:hypothetical protein